MVTETMKRCLPDDYNYLDCRMEQQGLDEHQRQEHEVDQFFPAMNQQHDVLS